MCKTLHKMKNEALELLKDLQGNPYKFYRGKSYKNISKGKFFCSCFDIAAGYRLYEDMSIIETEIAVSKPLVIDATTDNGYSLYGSLPICECKLCPEEKRKDIIEYSKQVRKGNLVSTDEILKWAMKTKDFDAVIIKNVCEGIKSEFPIYDVMLWNQENLVSDREVRGLEREYEVFRKNTFKRVDLSKYISEEEQDGVVSITKGNGYFVEHTIQQVRNQWYLRHELVVCIEKPINIYCIDAEGYVAAEQISPGLYIKNKVVKAPKIQFMPYKGCVRVKGVGQNCKYIISE